MKNPAVRYTAHEGRCEYREVPCEYSTVPYHTTHTLVLHGVVPLSAIYSVTLAHDQNGGVCSTV